MALRRAGSSGRYGRAVPPSSLVRANLGRPSGVLRKEDPLGRGGTYGGRVRDLDRRDVAVAACFVLAALGEAAVRHGHTPGLLAFDSAGALWLATLVVRRTHPVLPVCAIAGAGVVGILVTGLLWPDATDGAGVWILAMALACYSLGAHGAGRVVALGVLLPLVVVVTADWNTMSGWPRVNGIVFVTVFIGLLPTVVGRLVRVRHDRLRMLRDQHERIVRAQGKRQEAAVLAERLRTVERLQPTLLEGMQALARSAESGGEPGAIETSARSLLSRTREEVVALTAPLPPGPGERLPLAGVPAVDHVSTLRQAAQPWAVLGAGALVAGLFLEATRVLDASASDWVVLLGALAVGAPLVLAWWRPLPAVALAWVGAAGFARLVAPLDGTLSGPAFALVAAFAVAALSPRRPAVVGLVLCLLGQVVGVGTDDSFGTAVLVLLSWLGGLAVNEGSRLVEQSRANTELLTRQEAVSAARAVVEERLRLAREIHDAVGHSLTVVALQAGAARRLAGSDPERAQEVMRTVAAVARSGVTSLASGEQDADLVGLVERVRATGLEVEADLAGADLLEPAQRAVALRVVQEGLTNVLRHAPGARASVAVRPRGDIVEVAVSNSAPSVTGSGPGTGRGLVGVAERVRAAGGASTWGSLPDGGFGVRAQLPALTPESFPAAPVSALAPVPPR